MATDRIDSIIDNISVEAEIAKVEKRLAELVAKIQTIPKAQIFQDGGNTKQLSQAQKELSTVLDQLKVKNLELTTAIKEQQLVEKQAAVAARQAAEERRAAAAAQKEADKQAALAAKQSIADEKEAARQAQIAGAEKIKALQAQAKAEMELAAVQKERASTDLGTFDIQQGSGQSGTKGVKKTAEPAFVPANATEENLLFLTKTETALKANQAAQKDLGLQLKTNQITQEQYNAKIVEARAAELEYKKQIQLTNAELKARTNADFAVQGSIDAAKAENALLIPQRNALAVKEEFATPEDLAKLKELNAQIDKNNELIDKNNDLLGRQKINIGNYPTNAFSQTFKTLNSELESVQGKLVSGNFKGAELDQLTAKFNVLTNATKLTGKEFSSSGAQSKAFMEAGVQIGQVYGKNSDFFKQFSSQVQAGALNVKNMANEVAGVATKGKGFMSFLSTAYSGLRKLANIIPGAGIATLVLLLLGPLQAAGAAIVKWSSSATAGGKAAEDFKKKTEELNTVMQEAVTEYGNATKNVLQLKQDVQLAKEGFIDKSKVLKEYNETMGKVTGQLKTFDEVEAKIVKDGPAYIDMMFLKAEAAAAYAEAAKAAQKSVTAQADAEKDFGIGSAIKNIGEGLTFAQKLKNLINPIDPDVLAAQGLATVNQINKNAANTRKEQKKAFEDYNKMGDDFRRRAAIIAKQLGGDILGNDDPKKVKKSREDSDRLADEFRKKDMEALAKFSKDELNILKGRYKEEIDDQYNSQEERLQAAQDYYKVSLQLIQNEQKAQEDALKLETDVANKRAAKIDDPKKRADAQNAIEQYRVDKLKTIVQDAAISTSALEKEVANETSEVYKQSYDKIQKAAEAAYKVIVRESKIAFQNQKDSIDISKDDKLLQLEKDYAAGRIKTVEDYNNKKQAIEEAADVKQKELDLKRIREQEIVFEALYGTQNLALIKAAKDLEVEINAAGNKKIFDSAKELEDKRKELRNQLEDTFQGIVENSFDAQQAKDEAEMKRIDAKAQKEIDAINASAMAQEEKTRRITAIEKQADFERAQLEKKQQARDLARAKFEKAASIARVIQNTAEAVSRDLAGNKALIPFDIAIGAAQIALIVSQPLPKFAKGTKNAPKGAAIVGEQGSELILDRAGKMFLTPAKPTLVDLAGGEQIFKHDVTKDMLNHFNLLHILQKVQGAKQPVKVENGLNQRAIDILNKIERKAPFIIQIQNGMETTDYYMRNIKN